MRGNIRKPEILLLGGTVLLFFVLIICLSPKLRDNRPQLGAAFVKGMVRGAGGEKSVLMACQEVYLKFPPREGQFTRPMTGSEYQCLPKIIQGMNPDFIDVSANTVMISFSGTPGLRDSILVFFDDAEQYGTEMITNKLWYWNYTPSRETREAFESWCSERDAYLARQKDARNSRGGGIVALPGR
jgi:hypothetical protein